MLLHHAAQQPGEQVTRRRPSTVPISAICRPMSRGRTPASAAAPQGHADADLAALRLHQAPRQVERRQRRARQQEEEGDQVNIS
jgi:hypothetical protein